LNSQFNSKLIATRLVAEALMPQLNFKAEEIVEKLKPAIDDLVDNFFRTLVTHMGKTQSLKEQVPDVPGARDWNPLGEKYVRRKGTAAFWIYTLSPKVTRDRNTAAKKLRGNARKAFKRDVEQSTQNTLINTLGRMSGTATFGETKVTIKPPGEAEYEWKSGTRKQFTKRKGQITGVKKVPVYSTISALDVKINIQLWSAMRTRDRAHVENWLLTRGQVGISRQTHHELTNPKGHPRPLIRPWMAYYSGVRVPDLIKAAIANFKPYGGIDNINVKRN